MISITIITVVFNAVKTFENTLSSVLKQTYKHIDYIVIDGGSTDGTLDIIRKYESALAFWKSEPDKGIYDAMNKSLNYANTDYVYFLGADDELLDNNVIKKMAEAMESNGSKEAIFYGNVFYKKVQKKYDGRFYDLKFCLRNICHQAIFYPKSIYSVEKYDLRYKLMSDYVLNLKLWKDKKHPFIYLDQTVCLYNDEGMSGTIKDDLFLSERLSIVRSTFSRYVYWYAYLRSVVKKVLLNG